MLHIRWGALLHDIDKMGVPDHILLKPGELTEEDRVADRFPSPHVVISLQIALLQPDLQPTLV
jgi:HD-GYP domain-containing protein (c-di-GMP phosphodiesterase class II)